MIGFKFALMGVFVAITANVIGDVAAGLVAAAAASAALGYMWKLVRRAAKTYDVVDSLPATLTSIDERLGRLESKAKAIHEPVEALARDLGAEHRGSP